MSESADNAAAIVAGPVVGAFIAVLFFPTGCGTSAVVCPNGKQTDFLGLTLGGLVGNVDKLGAFVIGIIAAGLVWFVVDAMSSGSS